MKNFEYLADEIYEFFDEIIGSIVPGLYFCSYIIFNVLAVFFAFEIKLERQSIIVLLLILTISYVIGTMFRRSNSREPDSKSARYTYYKSCPHDDNDYAFGKMMPNDEYKDFINDFVLPANQNKIDITERCYGFKAILNP